ncbi:MAG: glycosyltransferase, partial [Chthoniobacterales bacterium]
MSRNATELALSVVIPTHNPRMDYLRRVLQALEQQTLAKRLWELVIIDNGSREALAGVSRQESGVSKGNDSREEAQEEGPVEYAAHSTGRGDLKLTNLKHNTPELELGWHPNARIVREEKLGLTFARLRGFAEAKGELIVMVDDDNVLNPDYLANAVRIAEEHKEIGALGGKCLPEFETQPEPWMEEFLPLLALRDHGEKEIIAGDSRAADGSRRVYPDQAAPIGAGMVVRSSAAAAYAEGIAQRACGIRHTAYGRTAEDENSLKHCPTETPSNRAASVITDRRGDSLASAGDSDLVFTILRDGWKVGYFPQLKVTHLIPSNRLTVDYLARANRGVQRSWVEVLRKHDACPWSTISPASAPFRKVRAYFKCRGWQKLAGFT